MEDELASDSVLLPPSLDFVPDYPEKVRLSEAAVSAFQAGRMRSASRARHPEPTGNVFIPPDQDDEVRIEQSPSVSPELAGSSMRHVLEGASAGIIDTRRSSTSPLRHGFSKSITELSMSSQVGHHHRRSADAKVLLDDSAEGPSRGRLGGENAGQPPRNLLAQAAMQVLQESDDMDNQDTGARRGRPLGRYNTTATRGPSDTASVSRGMSSTSVGSSVPNHSRSYSRRGSIGSTAASAEGSRVKGRAAKPVGFGSGAPSSRAATGLRPRSLQR